MKKNKPLAKSIFIVGTDTGVGKTVVTKLLTEFLNDFGFKATWQKWIQTGRVNDLPSGAVYKFKLPTSPHLAAQAEKKKVDPQKIKKALNALTKKHDFVVVEGIGGALVPYDQKNLVIDLAQKLKLPVIIVAQNKLGVINHALLTIEALKKRQMKILGIVFNHIEQGKSKAERLIQADNPHIIQKIGKIKVLGTLPCSSNYIGLQHAFKKIGSSVLKELNK